MTTDARYTWVCRECQKTFRRIKTVASLSCPHCKSACRHINWQVTVPSPKRKRQWQAFAERNLCTTSTKDYYAAILDAQLRVVRKPRKK